MDMIKEEMMAEMSKSFDKYGSSDMNKEEFLAEFGKAVDDVLESDEQEIEDINPFEQMNEAPIREIKKVKKGSSGSTWKRDESAAGLGNVLKDTSKDTLDRFFDYNFPNNEEIKSPNSKDPNEIWTGKNFLNNAGIYIDGKTETLDATFTEDDDIRSIEDDDIRSLEKLPKAQKSYRNMRWYEKIIFRIKNFFLFVWTYWSVKRERSERKKFVEDLRLAMDTPRVIVTSGLDRSATSVRSLPTSVELDRMVQERRKESLATFGSVGKIRRR